MIRCCIFDADGTLLDSMPMWRDITYEYAQQKGIHAPEGLHRTLNRLSLEQCAAYYQGLGVAGTVEEIAQELSQCALEGYRTRVPEKPHAGEFLRLLQENHIHIAVATASNREGVLAALDRLGMLPPGGGVRHLHRSGEKQGAPGCVPSLRGKLWRGPGRERGLRGFRLRHPHRQGRRFPRGGSGGRHFGGRRGPAGNPGGHCPAL